MLLIIVISKQGGMLFNFWHKYAVCMDYIRIPEQGNYREITGKLWENHPRPWWLKCKRFHLVNMGVHSMYDNMHLHTSDRWNVFSENRRNQLVKNPDFFTSTCMHVF